MKRHNIYAHRVHLTGRCGRAHASLPASYLMACTSSEVTCAGKRRPTGRPSVAHRHSAVPEAGDRGLIWPRIRFRIRSPNDRARVGKPSR